MPFLKSYRLLLSPFLMASIIVMCTQFLLHFYRSSAKNMWVQTSLQGLYSCIQPAVRLNLDSTMYRLQSVWKAISESPVNLIATRDWPKQRHKKLVINVPIIVDVERCDRRRLNRQFDADLRRVFLSLQFDSILTEWQRNRILTSPSSRHDRPPQATLPSHPPSLLPPPCTTIYSQPLCRRPRQHFSQ